MSSFNINGPSNNQPLVQSSQNLGRDGGGGGNTGYMNMRKKKGKNENREEDNSVFLEEDAEDTFVKTGKKNSKEKKGKFLGVISKLIKNKNTETMSNNDSFEKRDESEIQEENTEEEDYEEYASYEIPVSKTVDPIEDDEYEIAQDDDYYGGIDV